MGSSWPRLGVMAPNPDSSITRSVSRPGTTGSSMSVIATASRRSVSSPRLIVAVRHLHDHRQHKENPMRVLNILTVAVVLVLTTLISERAPVSAQDASPVIGSAGGTLYTYDSGEAGFFTKTYFYDTGSEVVAFDAQFTPELAEEAIAFLREQTKSPITYLVITHPNPDKFNGAPAFQAEGAEVIASNATEAAIPGVHEYKKAGFVGMGMFTEETYPEQATIDETFTGTHTIELSDGKTVELS